MSDFDDDFMHDDEDYEFEYEEEEEEPLEADLENQYYNAKSKKEEDLNEAMTAFESILEQETEKGEWGFKALKQLIKASFKLGKLNQILDYYARLLVYTEKAVTKNYTEKSIHSLLDLLGTCSDLSFLEKFYEMTLKALNSNQRLCVKTQLKLAKLLLDRKEYMRLIKVLRSLKEVCQAEDASFDDLQRKGTHLLEIYTLEIQMYTETKNHKKLQEVYQQSLLVKSAIPHPRIMGIIRQCGGKMHMEKKEWQKAQQDFFEAFKNFDEAGSPQRIQCLKYLVLANMLTASEINPFDSQETKPYKNDPQIVVMTNLVAAFQQNEILEFQKILEENKQSILGDSFIKMYIEEVLKTIRIQVIQKLIQPYQSISLSHLQKNLKGGISMTEVEQLLVEMILDEQIDGQIDGVDKILYLNRIGTEDQLRIERFQALHHLIVNSLPATDFTYS